MDVTPGELLHISFSEFREYNKLEIHDTAAMARQAAAEELEERLPQRPEQRTPVVWYGQAVRCSGVCRTVVETSTSDDILLQPELIDIDAPTTAANQETIEYLQEALQTSRAAEARWVKRVKTLERRLDIIHGVTEGTQDMTDQKTLKTAIDNLTKQVKNGALLASTDPAELLQQAAETIIELRALSAAPALDDGWEIRTGDQGRLELWCTRCGESLCGYTVEGLEYLEFTDNIDATPSTMVAFAQHVIAAQKAKKG